MASVPRRGAEIRAVKVFRSKIKNSRKCNPDAFIFTKMVLRVTNSSHLKTFITVGHGGEFDRKKLILSPELVKNSTEKRKKTRRAVLRARFIIQIAIGGSKFIPNVHRNDCYGP